MVKVKSLLVVLAYAVCLLGVAPVFPHLELFPRLLFLLAAGAGMFFDRRGRYPLRGFAATLLSLALFLYYVGQIRLDHLIPPVVHILVLLQAVRLASEKSPRHFLQIYVLAIFSLAASSLLSLSSLFFLYLVLLVVLVTVSLVLLSYLTAAGDVALTRRQLRQVLLFALLLPAGSLLLMLLFFFVLPRTQYPLWDFLNPAGTATAGFSDKVEPGSFSQMATIKELAFRVQSEQLAPEQLYWRGIVLNRIEGNAWIRSKDEPQETVRLRGGRRVEQTVFPEPGKDSVLFALDAPAAIEGVRARRSNDLVFTPRRQKRRFQYLAVSLPGAVIEVSGPPPAANYLQVPPRVSPRVAALAERIRQQGKSGAERVTLLEEFFRRQGLTYSNRDLPVTGDPVDEFLFGKKSGYCEFFASSFAVVLRLAGVPARLVGGYYGGEYNELGGYYLVTEDLAHVWVEAYIAGRGWVRFDPSSLARNARGELLAGRSGRLGGWLRVIDSLNYLWNRTVIAYDLGGQLQLARQATIGLKKIHFAADPGKALRWAALLLLSALALISFGRLLRRPCREERLLLHYFRTVRKRFGVTPDPATGLAELALRLGDPRCREFADLYMRVVYRDRRLTTEDYRHLRQLVKSLRSAHRKDGGALSRG